MSRLTRSLFILLCCATVVPACTRTREYELRGQVIAVNRERQELTIRHEDIPGFMPGMTMPFRVKEARLLEQRVPGDLVRARLAVGDSGAVLTLVERTGQAPLPADSSPLPGSMLDEGDEVPDAMLTDQSSVARRFSDWRGHTTAVTFIYTRCPLPDFCPLMDRHFAAIQREILADPWLRERARLVSVSFDPGFDTPAVLAAHAARIGADPSIWTFVTGERDAIDAFARAFGVSVIRDDAHLQEIVHNLRTAVIDRRGRVVEVFNGNDWKPAEVLAAMRRAGE
jgi:protein SCO1/2